MRVVSCACCNQLFGYIEQSAIAVLGGGAACCSLFTSLLILFVLLRISLWRGWELYCSLPASKTLYITCFEMLVGKWKKSSHFGGCPTGAVPPLLALAFLLSQESCVLHNPEQELIRDGRRTRLALFVSLCWWDQIFALTLNSAWVLALPLHSRAIGNIVPPKPPFPLLEDGGNLLLLLFYSVK